MKRALIITAAMLVLAPLAVAGHRDTRRASVTDIAHRLERAARHLHRSAEAQAHHYDTWEERALRRLHTLDARARHFHRQIERRWRHRHHVERDYQKLVDAYFRAAESFRYLRGYGHLDRDFHRVRVLMHELMRFYGDDPRAVHPRYGYDGSYRHGRHAVWVGYRWRR